MQLAGLPWGSLWVALMYHSRAQGRLSAWAALFPGAIAVVNPVQGDVVRLYFKALLSVEGTYSLCSCPAGLLHLPFWAQGFSR